MRIAVTGGAGYIGSHTVRDLMARGDQVVVIDDLSTGDARRLPAGVTLARLDLRDVSAVEPLAQLLTEHRVDGVIHFAARKSVSESMRLPASYVLSNVAAVAVLLEAMRGAQLHRLVFSSTAAVYGDVDGTVDEEARTEPISPYGATKLAAEQLLGWAADAGHVSAASLRYFNVAGTLDGALAERDAENLIPQVVQRLEAGLAPRIFGDDYATPDGTCVRDFVHVADVSSAHLAVLDSLPAVPGHRVYNVGTGTGSSVRATIAALTAAVGLDIEPEVLPRRVGDAAVVVADSSRIRTEVGWAPSRTLDDIVASAVQ